MNCRYCHARIHLKLADLGTSPPSNAYLTEDALSSPETYFPLQILVCTHCWLVQTRDYNRADELFAHDYAYFSSISKTWLEHAQTYTSMITTRLGLGKTSLVMEIAANDGYLLRNFVSAGIPCLGIEPTASTAVAAECFGIPIIREFFGTKLARRLVSDGKTSDLIIGNNVFAHVPDINDFTSALQIALKPEGTITLEFPHVMRLIDQVQFDTMYHEHFSYLSLFTMQKIFQSHGLRIWDVEQLPTHGGSLRVYGCHDDDPRTTSRAVERVLNEERDHGLRELKTYNDFQTKINDIKNRFVSFLIEEKRNGKLIGAYGAAAKGNTLLNFAGVKPDLLPFVCDAAPSKQGKFLPGSRIPILPPNALRDRRPDYVLILPWNISSEVRAQCSYVQEWGAKFVVAVPTLTILQ